MGLSAQSLHVQRVATLWALSVWLDSKMIRALGSISIDVGVPLASPMECTLLHKLSCSYKQDIEQWRMQVEELIA